MAQFRWIGCILSCWALVAVPALCTSGWLLHPCACAEIEHHDCEHEDLDGCGHEADCSADPCQLVVNRWDDDGLPLPDAHDMALSSLPSSCVTLVEATGGPPVPTSPSAQTRARAGEAMRTTILLI